MEHPPPPPPPRPSMLNGSPAEVHEYARFYQPHAPPQDGAPFSEPMRYPQQMDSFHAPRFTHPQDTDRFQQAGAQWNNANMRPGLQHPHHPQSGYQGGHQPSGYPAHPRQGEHSAEDNFRAGANEVEGQSQTAPADAEASDHHEQQEQKNVHSDWSSLADEPMDFGQAPPFAEVYFHPQPCRPGVSNLFEHHPLNRCCLSCAVLDFNDPNRADQHSSSICGSLQQFERHLKGNRCFVGCMARQNAWLYWSSLTAWNSFSLHGGQSPFTCPCSVLICTAESLSCVMCFPAGKTCKYSMMQPLPKELGSSPGLRIFPR